jgi:hypothetical protein
VPDTQRFDPTGSSQFRGTAASERVNMCLARGSHVDHRQRSCLPSEQLLPLKMRAAAAFREPRFEVRQSGKCLDPASAKDREIDSLHLGAAF